MKMTNMVKTYKKIFLKFNLSESIYRLRNLMKLKYTMKDRIKSKYA